MTTPETPAPLAGGARGEGFHNAGTPDLTTIPAAGQGLDAALEYAEAGVPVFPCDPGAKRPLVEHGFRDATTDPDQIAAWWREHPGAMIGVPTGEASGIFVLVIDRDGAKGIDGFVALAELEDRFGRLPETRTVRTPRGGEHRYFRWPGVPIKNSAGKLGDGLDIRGDGGYVCAPPSMNAAGGEYAVTRDVPPAPAPQWLIDLLTTPAPREAPDHGNAPPPRGANGDRYAGAALDDEAAAVARAPNGQRNATLNRAAFSLGQFVAAGALSRGEVEAALFGSAQACGLVDDDGPEAVRKTIASGLAAGQAQPRDIPEQAAKRERCARPKGEASKPEAVGGNDASGAADPATDLGLALAFADRHAAELRYVAGWGRWLRWRGDRWAHDATLATFDLVRRLCLDTLAAAGATLTAGERRAVQDASTIAAVERLARSDLRVAATVGQWDADPWLMTVPGGTVDLRSGRSRAADRADYITKSAAVAPDFTRDCPVWRGFLHRVTGGDTELQDYLQRLIGYCLTGIIAEHMLAFLYGDGANGKSTLVNLLTWLFGDYATVAPAAIFEATAGDRHPTEVAGLRGARLVTAQETEQGRRWAESRVKSLTGGDPVTARFMRQDFFTFLPTFKILIAGNHKPALRNADPAMARRLHMVPFTVEIPAGERDGALPEKIKAEGPAILAWAIDGCQAWQRHGLHRPAAVRAATEQYLEAADAFGLWLADATEPGGTHEWEPAAGLMASWRAWAEAGGEPVGSLNTFADRMRRAGFDSKRQPGTGKSGFLGIRLKRADYTDDARYGA